MGIRLFDREKRVFAFTINDDMLTLQLFIRGGILFKG
jgi:hypothetical protein